MGFLQKQSTNWYQKTVDTKGATLNPGQVREASS